MWWGFRSVEFKRGFREGRVVYKVDAYNRHMEGPPSSEAWTGLTIALLPVGLHFRSIDG